MKKTFTAEQEKFEQMADDEDWIQENYKDKEELLQLLFDKDQLTNVLDTSKENMETEHTRMDSEAF